MTFAAFNVSILILYRLFRTAVIKLNTSIVHVNIIRDEPKTKREEK